jgi:hypothetical protein
MARWLTSKGNVYVADIVTDDATFLLQTFRNVTVTKRGVVRLMNVLASRNYLPRCRPTRSRQA